MTVRPIFICSNIKLLKMIKCKINTLILILSHVRQIFSFTGYNVNGREVPPWTEYKYFGDFPSDVINREYALQEANQRTYLMCPKGNQ